MKTILVTGSTGFLGKHLVAQLKDAEPEARLRLLCRQPDAWPVEERLEIAVGDITVREDVLRAAEGVDEIYHLAGVVIRQPGDPWILYTTHIEGTRNVCEAMRAHAVKKCVYVSTSGTVAVGTDPVDRSEDAPYTTEIVSEWPYYLSKIYAEKLVFWYLKHHQLPIVLVNPSLLLGPGDERFSSTGDVKMFLEGQIKVIPVGGLNLVDVRDAAAGVIAAMQKGRAGERYLLGGRNLSFSEWIKRTSKISGVSAPPFMVPLHLSLIGAKVLRRLMPLVGGRFDLDDASIKMSALYWYCDSTKARKELDFETRDPDQTLKDTIDYIRENTTPE